MKKCKNLVSVCKTLKFGFCLQDIKNLLLQKYSTKIVRYFTQNSPSVCVIKVCSNGSAFENRLLQNYSTKFLDTARK